MKTVWIARLTTGEALRQLPALLAGRATVYDSGRACPRAASLARRLSAAGLPIRAERLDFNRKDERGHALLYAAQDDLLASLGSFVEERLAGEPRWLRDAAHFRLREPLEDAYVFARWAIAAGAKPGDALIFRGGPEISIAAALYRERGFAARRRGGPSLRRLARAVALAAAAVAARFKPAPLEAPPEGAWVEFGETHVFDHAFWRKGLSEPHPPLVYYLDRADTPPTAERLSRIRAQGFSAVDLRGLRLFAAARLGPGAVAAELARSLGKRPLWLSAVVAESRLWRAAYESAYRRFQVRLLVQHQDRGWKPALQADAVERAGGVMLGYHWSNLPYALKDWYLTAQHAYFVWGPALRESMEAKGHSCRHILDSGLWLEGSGRTPAEYARLRQRCRFVLCLFDSETDYHLWQSPATQARFWDAVLSLLERHPDWGAAAKYKWTEFSRYGEVLPGGARLVERARALEAQGRFAVLAPTVSPIDAGRGADLAVCYTLNSAGVIAALRGARAVHWDAVGFKDYPLAKESGQRVLFSELDELCAAVEAAAAGDRSVGDFSRWARLYDRFGDDQAARRVGRFVSDYFAARRRLDQPLAALDEAARLYEERLGAPTSRSSATG